MFDLLDVGTDQCIFETRTTIVTRYLDVVQFIAQYCLSTVLNITLYLK